jgi:hypothetical protein
LCELLAINIVEAGEEMVTVGPTKWMSGREWEQRQGVDAGEESLFHCGHNAIAERCAVEKLCCWRKTNGEEKFWKSETSRR